MSLNVTITLPKSASDKVDLRVRRYELFSAIGELFELVVEAYSTDPSIAESDTVGQTVVVEFGDEPFLKQMTGIIRHMEQRSAVLDGDSHYVWTIVPALWLTTRRRDNRIFQDMSATDIVRAVLSDATYAGRIAAPKLTLTIDARPREYIVQYDETDWSFITRILADEGITSYFDHNKGSRWVLIDDTSTLAPHGPKGAIPFKDQSRLNAGDRLESAPHVLAAVVETGIETSAITIRDYNFEKPDFTLESKKEAHPASVFENEASLEAYTYEVGKFVAQSDGDTRAQHILEANRATRRVVRCTSSFALPSGFRMSLTDHPRADLDGEFLVVHARTVMEARHGAHDIELMDIASPYRPQRQPKARIAGTQTARIVGATAGEEIDVDKYGRVLVEFAWDRRDQHTGTTSRRVRVAQGWAGAGFGFVMLPRVGEEVIVAYFDGDPDQPIVVGRVHNALVTTPLKLPADQAISVWRSKSTPKSDGYNEIRMDDAAGAERLTMHAQMGYEQVVLRDAETIVGRNETHTVKGKSERRVVGDRLSQCDGEWSAQGNTVGLVSNTKMDIHSGTHLQITCDTKSRRRHHEQPQNRGGRAVPKRSFGCPSPRAKDPRLRWRGDSSPGRSLVDPHHCGRNQDYERGRRRGKRRPSQAELRVRRKPHAQYISFWRAHSRIVDIFRGRLPLS